ncbi:ZYRO0C01650p [Zygosaccharomyces rouxii]|uniref:ZYRO0C01650p n=1 Tax=Zygosaccharomyces rouxii (strain ATCC 2623 / CBS 732 / NBRC 1130 / NCYC 568 / NRRL Y-229) TaxID=559307 RepID=C5DSN4_ZYGRC|nr:uncharacterized protein ZYRO0C01650g [Zygosaccharomyces rouxii]CAR26795.1 ZYRO0C01650p [Zygosaccharomyces rouxii]
MSKRKPLTQQKLASEEEHEIEGEPKRKKVNKKSRNGEFIVPPMNQKFVSCLQLGMNLNLLEQGAEESLQFQGTVAGQLTQQIYELIRSDTLSIANLERCHKWKGESSEIEYYYLRSRYFVSEENGMVCDRKRDDRIVCEPASMFHLVMCSHLQNNHVTSYNIHRNLVKTYANITRDYIVTAISYCSKCNPDLKAKPFQKKRHKNVYWELLPLERVHIEVFEPFDGEKIQGRFSHLLYFRDYFSRYVWILPLQNDKRKHMIRAMSSFLLGLPRIPIFLESTTIDREHLFDLCGQIAEHYSLKLGLGVKNSQRFHNNGIKDMKELLGSHKEECLQDWNLCLKYGPFHINQNINVSSDGRPGDLLFTSVPDCNRKFVKKRNDVILDTPSQQVVHLGEGVLFLENNKEEHKTVEAVKENITHSDPDEERAENDNTNDTQVRIDEGDVSPSKTEPVEQRDEDGEDRRGESDEADIRRPEDEPIDDAIEQKKEGNARNHLKNSAEVMVANIPNDNHVNTVQMQPAIVRDDYIYDSDELADYNLEVEQKRYKRMRKSNDADDKSMSEMGPRKKRKLLGRKLQSSTNMDESIEL